MDIRGPDIIHRQKFDASTPVRNLKWTVAGNAGGMGGSSVDKLDPHTSVDNKDTPTLVAVQQSGAIHLLPITRASGSWAVEETKASKSPPHSSLENPLASFVLDAKSGADLSATPERLQLAMHAEPGTLSTKDSDITHLLVIVSATEARCVANLSGQKLSKVHWPQDSGEARSACVVEHAGWSPSTI